MVTPAQDAPFVIIFAGPNGSGKTSLINEVRNTGLAALGDVFPVPAYFINPDQVAKDLEGQFATQEATLPNYRKHTGGKNILYQNFRVPRAPVRSRPPLEPRWH